MVSIDAVREMAEAGSPASVIAERLGVSRQRVYQVAAKAGIALPRYHARTWGQRPPKPRLITGGVFTTISTATAGSISELLVAADLLARGYAVFMPVIHSRGHDVVAEKNGMMITVEVRSAHRNASGKLIYNRRPEMRSTHYALVVTGEPVAYDPPIE